MSIHWQLDEIALRRRMLFRLLKGFDFDKPVFRHEPISTTIAVTYLEDASDTFILKFQQL